MVHYLSPRIGESINWRIQATTRFQAGQVIECNGDVTPIMARTRQCVVGLRLLKVRSMSTMRFAKNHIAGFSISPQLTGFTGPGIVR